MCHCIFSHSHNLSSIKQVKYAAYWTCSFQLSQVVPWEMLISPSSSSSPPSSPFIFFHPPLILSLPVSKWQFLISHSEDTSESPHVRTIVWETAAAGSLPSHCSQLHFQYPRMVSKNHLQDDKRACCSLNSVLISISCNHNHLSCLNRGVK